MALRYHSPQKRKEVSRGKMNQLQVFFVVCCMNCKDYRGIEHEEPCKAPFPCVSKSGYDHLRNTLIRKTKEPGEKISCTL